MSTHAFHFVYLTPSEGALTAVKATLRAIKQ